MQKKAICLSPVLDGGHLEAGVGSHPAGYGVVRTQFAAQLPGGLDDDAHPIFHFEEKQHA